MRRASTRRPHGRVARAVAGAVLLALAIFQPACTANRMHRPVSVEENAGYTLAFIEFDDQGEMWAPEQLSRALAAIERANDSDEGAVLVAYMHGWQHDASRRSEEASGNVAGFKRFLATIRASFDAREAGRGRPLVGVYLGWRGRSGAIPGLDLLTFYSRAGAARRVAGTSASEVILRLLVAAKENPRSRTMLMGHSFGGQIIERAVTQALVGDLLTRSKREYGLLADLIFLVNPAAKSIQAKQFVEMLDRSRLRLARRDDRGRRYGVPIMVSVTSSADLATRWAFPVGTAISSVSKSFRRYPDESCLPFRRQRSFYIRTPGHNRALISHQVTAEARPAGEHGPEEIRLGDVGEIDLDLESGDPVVHFETARHRFTLRRRPGAANDTPYWIVTVPRELIPGHSGFFTPEVVRMIGAVLKLTGSLGVEAGVEVDFDFGVEPVQLGALDDGRVLFVDASRRIYQLDPEGLRPLLWGCLPRVADRAATVGIAACGREVFTVVSRPGPAVPVRRHGTYRTALRSVRLNVEQPAPGKEIAVGSDEGYGAGAFDCDERVLYLTPIGTTEIHRAPLTRATSTGTKAIRPAPEPWIHLTEAASIAALRYSGRLGALLVVDSASGKLFAVDDAGAEPQVRTLGRALGSPVAVAVDRQSGRIYVGDAEGGRIWRIDCQNGKECSPPQVFVEGEVSRPSLLSVGVDGTVWVGDPQAERILALSPDGRLRGVLEELPVE